MDPAGRVLNVDGRNFPLDRYVPIRSLGSGALGEVFLCRDLVLNKLVAVKRLHALTDDRVVAFHREAKIASKLTHEHIIKVLDFGTTESGTPFMVQEYFDGESLEHLIETRGRLDEMLAIWIFIAVCDALSSMHDHQIFHRDLKPANILIKLEGNKLTDLRIIDFGLSSITMDAQKITIVQGKTVVGTPVYMSPDQMAGEIYDARSEIYSIGCLLFEAITGIVPFDGETPMDIIEQHVHNKPPLISEVMPDHKFPIGLENLVDRCLSKDRDQRYQTMDELIAALKNVGRTREEGAAEPDVHEAARKLRLLPMLLVGITVCGAIIVSWMLIFSESQSSHRHQDSERESAFLKSSSPLQEVETEPLLLDSSGYVHVSGPTVTERLEVLEKKYKTVRFLSLSRATITDADMQHLRRLGSTTIECYAVKFKTTDGLAGLASIQELVALLCRDCQFSPRDLGGLRSCPRLGTLSLRNCSITDAHLENLAPMPQLRKLALQNDPEVTNAGLASLARPNGPKLIVWVNEGPLTKLTAAKRNQLLAKSHITLINQIRQDDADSPDFREFARPFDIE